jgi:hypothetical protein
MCGLGLSLIKNFLWFKLASPLATLQQREGNELTIIRNISTYKIDPKLIVSDYKKRRKK